MKNILVLHGPNLNLLGEREPKLYGKVTLATINKELRALARKKKCVLKIFQTNHEGKLVDLVQQHRKWADGILINPAAYTHTSIALRDALLGAGTPFVEVHLSKFQEREAFRKISLIEDIAIATVSGLKEHSYYQGLEKLLSGLSAR